MKRKPVRPTEIPEDLRTAYALDAELGLISEAAYAVFVGKTLEAVRNERATREGPAFVKFGNVVKYYRDSVKKFVTACTVTPTNQPTLIDAPKAKCPRKPTPVAAAVRAPISAPEVPWVTGGEFARLLGLSAQEFSKRRGGEGIPKPDSASTGRGHANRWLRSTVERVLDNLRSDTGAPRKAEMPPNRDSTPFVGSDPPRRLEGAPRRILRLPEVMARAGLSRASVYRGGREGRFPRPVKLTERASGWYEHEVDAWIEERASQRVNGDVRTA